MSKIQFQNQCQCHCSSNRLVHVEKEAIVEK